MPFNWLNDILDATSGLEPPKKFFYWSALSAISAVTKRNVSLRKMKDRSTAYVLYPNIYTFLVGDSAVVRKGTPVKMARKLVQCVDNTRIISGRSTIQGIILELSKAYTTTTGKIRDTSSCFICASEFRSSLIADPQAMAILTDLYDGDFSDDWKNMLKSGTDELKDVYIVMLGGSNPAYLKESITGADIEGGIIGRSFLVYANERANIEPLTDDTVEVDTDEETEMFDYKKMSQHLIAISKLKGRFKFSMDGKEVYDKWYRDFSTQKIEDKTGIMGRIHDQILKVAMLISLAKRLTLVLEKDDIVEAIRECMELAGNVNRTIMSFSGTSDMKEKTSALLQLLLNAEDFEAPRHKILQKCWGSLDAFDLDRVVESLTEARALTQRRNGKAIYYKLTERAIQIFLFQKEGA